MTEDPRSNEQSNAPSARLHERRLYFENLAKLLLAGGVDGTRVGRIVAELDDHLADSGTDPVEELGPVGALAAAYRRRAAPRARLVNLGLVLAFGSVLGIATAVALPLMWPDSAAEGRTSVPIGVAVYLALFSFAYTVMWGWGSRRVVGRRVLEPSSLLLLAPFALVMATAWIVVGDAQWEISTARAVWVLCAAAPLAVLLGVGVSRRTRVPVPGRSSHLHRLGWGIFGR